MTRDRQPLTLFTQSRNSAGERVRIALNLKGLTYEYVSVAAMDAADYRRINPQGLMPALKVGEEMIAQSGAILEYLEEVYPEHPLLPTAPIARAQARAFACLISADTHPLCNYRVRKYLVQELNASDASVLTWYRNWVTTSFTSLEEVLARRPNTHAYCFGDNPGWADIHLVPIVDNARRFQCDLSAFPRVLEIERRCSELEAFRRARPDAQPDYAGHIKTTVGPGRPG
jgi:maleylacetoacetate isomerase